MNTEGIRTLDFERASKDMAGFLAGRELMSLATSLDSRVTARTVTYVSHGLDIYFLSFAHHTKCTQIAGNPRVAACIENVQIEGTAEILGNALDSRNREYADIYRAKLPEIFALCAPMPRMVLVKMTPGFFVTYVRHSAGACLEHLDLGNGTACVFEELGKE